MRALKAWAGRIKHDVRVLWLAARDPRVPPMAKLLAGAVAAYVLSPIDLIPDFIPVLGYLDDLIIAPLGIMAVLAMIPAEVLEDLRDKAGEHGDQPVSRKAVTVVVVIWLAIAAAAVWWAWPYVNHLFYPD